MMEHKVIIAGGRDFNNYQILEKVLHDNYFDNLITTVICGDAQGADFLGARWAVKHGIPIQHFPAYWDIYGKTAGFIRNAEMGEYADAAIIFWDGQSKGTKHMIQTMNRLNKPVYIYDYNGNLKKKNTKQLETR